MRVWGTGAEDQVWRVRACVVRVRARVYVYTRVGACVDGRVMRVCAVHFDSF